MGDLAAPKEVVRFWRDPVLDDLEMLYATYVTYTFAPHAHEGFGIAIVESGAMAFEYQGETHVAPAGSIVVTHPGEVHTGRAVLETGYTYRTMLPSVSWIQQAASALSERTNSSIPYFASPVIQDRRFNQSLVALHNLLVTTPSALERESCFLLAMTHLVQHYSSYRPSSKPIGQEHRAVQQAYDYLVAHYSQNISLKALAARVDLSPFKLLRAFKKHKGLPPHAYLNHLRVHQAKKLLVQGWSIADAALETGFADQSHLNRHFKKMLGLTPGQYVRGCRANL